jgi:p-aminobenzoyl-glutamate transporter AbgT
MKSVIWIIVIVAAWFVLNKYIFPRLGVDT